ncbi:MAG TPA: ATP-binding protein, partial [Salinivirgaceae bacterium]|nr:ATP-binding protein [Salinivirgaceae bacterium]
MIKKQILNYQLYIWILLIFAFATGGVFLVVAYTYDLQEQTKTYIEQVRKSSEEALRMKSQIIAIRGLTYNYIFNRSDRWLDSLSSRRKDFIVFLDRARVSAVGDEEKKIVQQMSALFSNFEQNTLLALKYQKENDYVTANKLLIYSVQELLGTIEQKAEDFISRNKKAEAIQQIRIENVNELTLKILTIIGIGGIAIGLFLGYLLTHFLITPINQLILTVRGASGETVLEKLKLRSKSDIDELEERIKFIIQQMNVANEDLSRKNQLLQHSNKYAALGQIAPTIAHEIRNPLTAIKMLVYAIKESPNLPNDILNDLEIISGEVQRLEAFTKNFLQFAKPADPVYKIEDPHNALKEVIRLLTPRFKETHIQVVEKLSDNEEFVLADSGQLKQIFLNIFLNAIEVMPEGGLIEVQTRSEILINPNNNLKGKFIIIQITDSGPGIPAAIMNHLFEPYFKKSEMGVGIGLSISQSIA